MQTRCSSDHHPTPAQALERALAILGGQAALGRVCDVSQPSVFRWIRGKRRLPERFVLVVEAASGVSRHLLRPDCYPHPDGAAGPEIALPPLPVACDPKPRMQRLGTATVHRPRKVRVAPSANDNCCCPCHRLPPNQT